MKHTSAWPARLGYGYLILPVLIFFIGFCNAVTALLGTAILAVSAYFLYKNAPQLWVPSTKKEWILVAATALICFGWVYSSGIGAQVFQNSDHGARNAIFELLVTQPWPIIVNNGDAMITYYVGFWLPAATVGKLFHSAAGGYAVQMIWASLGVFLAFYYLLSALTKKTIWPVWVFIFFSGLDIVGSILFIDFSNFYPMDLIEHIEWWLPGFQFSSFTTQLYWVFNQAVPAWVLTLLLLHEKNNKGLVFLYACAFICATLPAIGLVPFLAWWCVQNGEKNIKKVFTPTHIWQAFKNALTFANLAGAGAITIVSYAYLSGNLSGVNTESVITNTAGLSWVQVICFVVLPFFMLEAGLYLLCVAHLQYKNPLFYLCTACLLVYCLLHIGNSPDFCMRGTIPALVLLCLFVLQSLQQEKSRIIRLVLGLLLLLGAVTPLHEMARTVVYTSKGYIKQRPHLEGSNFFSYTRQNMFLTYFGKRP